MHAGNTIRRWFTKYFPNLPTGFPPIRRPRSIEGAADGLNFIWCAQARQQLMAAGSSWPASLCNQPASAWPGCPPAPVPAWSSPAASTPGRLQPPGADHLASKPCLESPDYLPGSDSHLDGRQNISFWEIQVIAEMLLSSTIQYYGPRPRLTSFSRPSLVILVFLVSTCFTRSKSRQLIKSLQKKVHFANPESFCDMFIIGWRISGWFGKCMDAIQNIQIICKVMMWKVSGWSRKCLDDRERVWMIWKVSRQSKKCPADHSQTKRLRVYVCSPNKLSVRFLCQTFN